MSFLSASLLKEFAKTFEIITTKPRTPLRYHSLRLRLTTTAQVDQSFLWLQKIANVSSLREGMTRKSYR